MKHFVLILLSAILLYGGWQLMSRRQRDAAATGLAVHGLRLGLLILALGAAMWLAARLGVISVL